ncbi:MAG: beta-propeller fold lactonase family protein [Sandaracinaceae bacterium]|nr:beta-propeller fold lactonase family protein [Sandaracinaceae bacterium]
MRLPHLLALLLLTACDGSSDPDAGADAGARDAATSDAAATDAALADAAVADAGDVDAGPPPPPGPWTVYVTVGSENRLAVLDLDEAGVATERSADSLALPSNPGPLAHDPASRRLYVGLGGGSSGIATVSVAGASPTLEGVTPTPDPVYLSVAPGQRLVSAFFGQDELRVHDVSGAPAHPQVRMLSTADEPHCAIFGPNGLLYVPHRNGMTTWWLRLRADGTLDMAGELASEPGAGPRHIAFSPDGAFAYLVNEYSDSVSTHAVGADGALTRLETVDALPGGPSDANSAADIHVTEDGRFVYSSNRGEDSIARFAVGADGRLTFLGTTPTEARPREFELTAGGGYLLALGQDSGSMSVYRIEDDGDLTSTSRVALGDGLLWAIAVPR